VDGKILFIPVKGDGKFAGNFTGSGDVRVRGIHKEMHYIVNKLDIKVTIKTGRIEVVDIFGSNKAIAEIVGQAINQNFDLFSKDLIPLIEKSLSQIFKRTANKILERFTLAQLFP
jgi:uncharacterized membrane protein YheB (UPF0754 family)